MYTITLILILLMNNDICVKVEGFTVGPTLTEQLDREHRNAVCCRKKMRCCKKLPPPNIELRAVIVRCPKTSREGCHYMNRYMKKTLSEENQYDIKKFEGFDEDEPLVQSMVTKCHKKIVLTMKIKNRGPTNTKSQFIVIDHVYDPLSRRAVQLLNPYIIKMKQEHVSQTYGLKFLDYVNSNAREQVYNKHDGNYTGCSTDEKNPTCGVVKYHGKVIPYSQGFCCSCDAQKNAERQPQTAAEPQPYIEQSDPAYLFDAVPCPRTYMHEKTNKSFYYIKNKTEDTTSVWNVGATTCPPYYGGRARDVEVNRRRIMEEDETGNNQQYNKEAFIHDNYNIQNMNDEYEETVANQENVLSELSDKSRACIKEQKKKKKQRSRKTKFNSENYFSPKNFLSEKYGHMPTFQRCTNTMLDDTKETNNRITKRQVQSSGVQIRGGQNCADRYTPRHFNPETYHESTHCLRFSPIWYAVYKLNKPVIEQEIIIQMFEKYETESGTIKWKDLTNGKKVKLGTFFSSYQDNMPTISLTYVSKADEGDFCLDINQYRLLIPEGLKNLDIENYPEAKGGPPEFLILKSNQIFMSGDQCDSAGVGFEAFYKQPNRCSMPRGTCLRRQPKHLWLHDKKMERQRRKGCYFLKYYGQLSKDPIRENINTSEKYLALNYYGLQVSVIEMEINADFNAVLRPQSSAVITEVYIDSTNLKTSFLTIKVTNSGLLASVYMVRISDCPLDVQGKLKEVTSKPIIISPQNQYIFRMNISNDFSADIFFCSIEALDVRKEIIALRRIRIQLLDRCVCTWHCLCACIGSSHGLKCIPMQMEHYHAAGFVGGLPVVTYAKQITFVDDVITLLLYMLMFMLFTLFVLGLTKALIGFCCAPVGMWGLNILLDLPKPMKRYYEKEIDDREVQYDEDGWPVNPDTKEKVRNIPKAAEFCTNVLFFFTYPCIVLLLLSRRLCCPFCNLDRYKKYAQQRHGQKVCTNPNCIGKMYKHQECQIGQNKKGSKSREQIKKENQDEQPKRTRVKVSIKDARKGKKIVSNEAHSGGNEDLGSQNIQVSQCIVSDSPFKDFNAEQRLRVEEDYRKNSRKYLKDVFERIVTGHEHLRNPDEDKKYVPSSTDKLKTGEKDRKSTPLGFLSRERSLATVKSVKGKSNLWEDDNSSKVKQRKRRPKSM